LISKEQFKNIFTTQTPLLDVRAPCEFAQGAFPHTTNLPLLSDEERHDVGLCYKQQSQDEAIKLGHEFVSGEIKEQRVEAWKAYCLAQPNAYLYCSRGGMRSHLVQEWLKEIGIDIPLIHGGYKALRNYLLEELAQPVDLIRISGQTGVGKTDLLLTLTNAIDLEGLANHRGSAFGKNISNQPTQIEFENLVAIDLLNSNKEKPIIVEDEGRYIGRLNLPLAFFDTMKETPVVLLTSSHEERVDRIYRDYVFGQRNSYIEKFPQKGEQLFEEFLTSALIRIQKRLGGERYAKLSALMNQGILESSETLHKQWINDILVFYYDPMYQYQIDNKAEKIQFTGNALEVAQYLKR
jgi:tRNA 2-selenouridine synthase